MGSAKRRRRLRWLGRLRGIVVRLKGPRGEQVVRGALASLETEGYKVLHEVETSQGRLDHLVLGPTGAYAIDTKPWSGTIYATRGGRVVHDGVDEEATLRQASSEAREVKKRLERAGMDTWVHSVVVPTGAKPKVGTVRVGSVMLVAADDLARHIRSRRPYLTASEVRRAMAALSWGERFADARFLEGT